MNKKIYYAILPVALILGGCASTPVMQPKVEAPPQSQAEPSDSLCWDKVKSVAGETAEAVKDGYNKAAESETVKDLKEGASELWKDAKTAAGEYLLKEDEDE